MVNYPNYLWKGVQDIFTYQLSELEILSANEEINPQQSVTKEHMMMQERY